MGEVFSINEYPFVTDEEILASKEYKEMYKEVKDELVTQKVDQIVEGIEKVSINDSIIYKVRTELEFLALKKYIDDSGMRLEDGWEIDLSRECTILVDNSADSFVHVYSGKWLDEFKSNVQKLMDFI